MVHRLVGVQDNVEGSRRNACCSCGWRSTTARSLDHARARWRIHVAERRAAEMCAAGWEITRQTQHRTAELTRVRVAATARRDSLHQQRARLQQSIQWLHAAERPPLGPAADLDCARVLAGLSVTELWWAYLALGGSKGLRDLAAELNGDTPLPVLDHDLVALALNERFAEAGFGYPVEYWRASP